MDFCEIKQDTTILDGHKKQGWGYFLFSSCHRHVQPNSDSCVKWLHKVKSPPHLVSFWAENFTVELLHYFKSSFETHICSINTILVKHDFLNVDKDYRLLVNWVKGWVDFAENNFLDSAHFVCIARVHSSEISQRLYLVTTC